MPIVETTAETITPLRFAVLRPHRPIEESRYPTDQAPGTIHLAAYDGETLVGCTSAHLEPAPGREGQAYRLRGMAVQEGYRGKGIGAQLLEAMEARIKATGTPLVWCNGRTQAGAFYRRHGWQPEGAEFDIVGVPHYVFSKVL
ncbi:MAG TPA: GNAT family N-acetyltransferase [Pantanalinema sp.]